MALYRKMEKNVGNFSEIFRSSNLNGQSFCLNSSSFDEETKNEIVQIIINNNGKCSFSMNEKTVLIINNSSSLNKIIREELLNNKIGKIYFYDNIHTEKFKLGKKNKKRILRIITAKALKQEINYFHANNFEYFLSRNLPKNANKMTTLALILKNRMDKEKIVFYVFNNSKKESENDIPFFHKNAPDGYSFFCSKEEYSMLINFLKKKKKMKKVEQKELESEPIPNEKHNLCQICKVKFENYLEHIHSKFHEKNKLSYNDSFLRMKNTFKRIVAFNEEKKLLSQENGGDKWKNIKITTYKKKKEIKDENKRNKSNGNENISWNINSENYNSVRTKCDSLFNENKMSKRKRSVDIPVKDIKCILNSIKCRPVKNYYHNKKRKKSEIHKKFFNENYIYDFQKTTGKISYFVSLLNNENNENY